MSSTDRQNPVSNPFIWDPLVSTNCTRNMHTIYKCTCIKCRRYWSHKTYLGKNQNQINKESKELSAEELSAEELSARKLRAMTCSLQF